ncbi:MAG: hypothetical protein DWQ04_08070 [Chloroflexi bacterium]|nr:MAG: hypothetical protein DWQ04_08070 [Chloroflexota bacterium]
MELKTYLAIIWRRKWIIAIVTILFTVIATIGSLLITPTYISYTTVRVATYGGGIADIGRYADLNYSQLLMSTYSSILTSGTVRGQIKRELNLQERPLIFAEIIPNTELLRIRGEATNPDTARDIADLGAQLLIEKSQELYTGGGQSTQEILGAQIDQIKAELDEARLEYDRLLSDSSDDSESITAVNQSIALKERTYLTLLEQYESVRVNEALRSNAVTIIEPAYTPPEPSKPRHEVNIVLGILVGMMGGLGLVFVVDNLDTTLYSTREIEAATKLPTIGKIPLATEANNIIRVENEFQPEFEAIRRLRTNIFAANLEDPPKVMMVTSAERGEGKSTIMSNLAVSIAQSGKKVVVIDCDLRIPTMHEIFEQPNKRGLSDILLDNHTVDEVVQDTVFPRLNIITTGELPPNPTELLGSLQMQELLENLKKEFDIILLDTPALLSVTDAAVLVPLMDEVLLVVTRSRSHRDAVSAVRRQLKNVNAKSVNVVVNRAEHVRSNGYY